LDFLCRNIFFSYRGYHAKEAKEQILEAEANVAYLTPAKLQEEAIKSFYNNHKHTFGNKGELPGLVGLLNMDESN
jgi:hypothetical protein